MTRSGTGTSRATQIEQPLVDEQLVVVEVHERVDAVALEQVVADRRLVEQVALPQRELLAVAREREEELRLERRAVAARVEVGEERVVAARRARPSRRDARRAARPARSCRGRSGLRWRGSESPRGGSIGTEYAVRCACAVRAACRGRRLFDVRLPLVRPFETSFGRIDAREFVLVAVRRRRRDRLGRVRRRRRSVLQRRDDLDRLARLIERTSCRAVLGRSFSHPREVSGALVARARTPHGQGRARDGHLGSPRAARRPAALRGARRAAAADRGRRVDRHPAVAPTRSSIAWPPSSPRATGASRSRSSRAGTIEPVEAIRATVRRHPADGRCERGLHDRRRGRARRARSRSI